MRETKSQPITKRMVWEAFKKVKANRGGAGIDGISIEQYEADLENNLYKLWNRMTSGSYFPPPVKEVQIPKEGRKIRTLGVPTVADRIAQMVVKQHLEPTIDPQFHPNSFGYRPGRSAHDALEQARTNCWKMRWVVDVDIQSFFDEIDHGLLMKAFQRHTDEKWVLMYIERWLKVPMIRPDGSEQARTRGTPQGGVVSPLAANLFLHYAFDKWMEKEFPNLPFERYADDIVVHCWTFKHVNYVLDRIKRRLAQCKLSVHPEKTRIAYCKQDGRSDPYPHVSFDFLGYTFKPRMARKRNGNIFLGFGPGAGIKAKKKMNDKIRAKRIHRKSSHTLEQLAGELNPMLRGWINYFSRYRPSELTHFFFNLNQRLLKWAMRKHKRFRTSKRKALRWLRAQCEANVKLFAHWQAGYRPDRIQMTG